MPMPMPSEYTMATDYDDRPDPYHSAEEAVRFAERFLTADRPAQLRMVKKRRDGFERPRYASLEEAKDYASTISIEARKLAPYTVAETVLFLWGPIPLQDHNKHRRREDAKLQALANYLGRMAWNGPGSTPLGRRKTIRQCIDLAHVILEDARRRENTGRGLSQEVIGQAIDVTRQQLVEQWGVETAAMRAEIDRQRRKGEADLSRALGRIGVVV